MKKYMYVLFLLLFSLRSSGQEMNSFRLIVDEASFNYDEEQSYVEVYYSFPRAAVKLTKEKDLFSGSALINVTVTPLKKEDAVITRVWRVPVTLTDTVDVSNKVLIGKISFTLPAGRYTLFAAGRDEARPANADTIRFPFDVRLYAGRTPVFSDLELSSSIRKIPPDSLNIFYKNTLEVIPNPALIYGKSLPSLMYYSELYHLPSGPYILKSEIVSSYGKTMLSKSQRKSGQAASRVEVGSLEVGEFPGGVYTFIISLTDTANGILTSQSKKFYIYNPDVKQDSTQVRTISEQINQEFAMMGEEELNLQFGAAQYVASKDEQKTWASLAGTESKRKFLTQFWMSRDMDPSTAVNEFYWQYQERVAYCNEHFRTAYRPGWKSDRGRVFITYGPPDNVERKTTEIDKKPHEIWYYDNIQGGVQCVFMDRGGFNNYELIHSTMRNELNDPNYESRLRTN